MSENEELRESDHEAQRLVGKFLQEFALLEQVLDGGIAKLLGLQNGVVDIVCSSIPFAKKVAVYFSAENLLGSRPDRRRTARLRNTRSAVLRMNEQRVMFAHSPFSGDSGGRVTFRRVVTSKALSVSNVTLNSVEVDGFCAELHALRIELDALVHEMKPFTPSLDFTDARNSGLITLLF